MMNVIWQINFKGTVIKYLRNLLTNKVVVLIITPIGVFLIRPNAQKNIRFVKSTVCMQNYTNIQDPGKRKYSLRWLYQEMLILN